MTDQKKAQSLRDAYNKFVTHPDGHWKGSAIAVVNQEQRSLVREAMNFMGSLVDQELILGDGQIALYSRGYWAHGF